MLERHAPRRPPRARVIPETFRRANAIPTHELTKVGRGAHVRTSEWDELYSEGRVRTLAHAVIGRAHGGGAVASHTTAAALHNLPLYRVRSDRVDVTYPGTRTRHNGADIVRHSLPLPDADVEVIDGIRVTTLDRTVYDAIRAVSLEAAVVIFDAALRAVAWRDDERAIDVAASDQFRARVVERINAHAGARGIRQARFVAEIADGRAQLPGESIARLWMLLLSAPAPVPQYRVDDDSGRFALLDFAFPALQRWLEFDGKAKYEDPYLLNGRSSDEVLADQDERERWISRVTGWRPDRFGFAEMPDIDAFARYLRSIGLLP